MVLFDVTTIEVVDTGMAKHGILLARRNWGGVCRTRRQQKSGLHICWREDNDSESWYDGNSDDRTHNDGKKLPNELGL